MSVRFKVCCIQDAAELRLAVRYGASAVGLVSAMPSGPGPIPDERIAALARAVPPGVASFLLTSARDAAAIAAQVRRLAPAALQIVGRPELGCRAALRAAFPALKLVQVIHVTGPEAVDAAAEVAPDVDALLLDTGSPTARVKELGGTGRVHDWSVSRRIAESVPVPVWLAGGLTPENVASAIATVRPFAVDVCSGLRTNGRLDEAKLARLAAAVRQAGGILSSESGTTT